MPSNISYFSANPLLLTPIFRRMSSENQFILFQNFIHFNDNTKNDDTSGEDRKLFKILPIVNYLRSKF